MRIVIIFFWVHFFSALLPDGSAQNAIVCPLTKGEVASPYKDKRAELSLNIQLLEDTTSSKVNLPDIKGQVHRFVFGMEWLFESNTYFLSFIKENNYLRTHNLILYRQSSNRFYNLVVDENGNADFRDDKIVKINPGETIYTKLNLLLDPTTNFFYQVAIEATLETRPDGTPFIYCRNLTKFTLKQPLEDSTLSIDILTNYMYPNFKIKTLSLESDSVEWQNVIIGEPFYFNGKLRVLNNLNVFNQTVELRTLAKNELPFGYRTGYYINMPRLIELSAQASYPINWSTPEYFLLYFWGHWCQPCTKKMPETKKMAADLSRSGKIAMISYPMILSSKDLPKLEKWIQKDSFLCPQVIQNVALFTTCEAAKNNKPFINSCNVISLVHNHEYPTFILVNRKGKILFRGANKNNELTQVLKDLKP
jgi:thiol-disulfide isomerase/thioredoxin